MNIFDSLRMFKFFENKKFNKTLAKIASRK